MTVFDFYDYAQLNIIRKQIRNQLTRRFTIKATGLPFLYTNFPHYVHNIGCSRLNKTRVNCFCCEHLYLCGHLT